MTVFYSQGDENKEFYTPTDRGFEKKIAQRLDYWKNLLSGKPVSSDRREDKVPDISSPLRGEDKGEEE